MFKFLNGINMLIEILIFQLLLNIILFVTMKMIDFIMLVEKVLNKYYGSIKKSKHGVKVI
jgi:hypothetical protein